MARMLSISQATLHRCLEDFNLQISHAFSFQLSAMIPWMVLFEAQRKGTGYSVVPC